MRATAKFRPNQKKELGHSLAIGSLADGPSDAKFGVGDTRMHEAAIFCFPSQTNPNFAAYRNSSCNLCFCRYRGSCSKLLRPPAKSTLAKFQTCLGLSHIVRSFWSQYPSNHWAQTASVKFFRAIRR